MLKSKIIHYWLVNKVTNYSKIAEVFNTNMSFVADTIEEYKREPYIVRESIMNYE